MRRKIGKFAHTEREERKYIYFGEKENKRRRRFSCSCVLECFWKSLGALNRLCVNVQLLSTAFFLATAELCSVCDCDVYNGFSGSRQKKRENKSIEEFCVFGEEWELSPRATFLIRTPDSALHHVCMSVSCCCSLAWTEINSHIGVAHDGDGR